MIVVEQLENHHGCRADRQPWWCREARQPWWLSSWVVEKLDNHGGCRAARQPSPYTLSPPANINPPFLAGNNPIPPPGSAGNSPIPPPPNPMLPYYPWFYLNLPGVPCIHCSAATIITQSTTWISCQFCSVSLDQAQFVDKGVQVKLTGGGQAFCKSILHTNMVERCNFISERDSTKTQWRLKIQVVPCFDNKAETSSLEMVFADA
ncbi:hypothetical protein Fot_02829 [Forsythia ovata]|uniref:Uncharacterized protein n=1 Tax=Forsythia ovata TaxID=205694 RepID=A0ABD1X7Z1_9LAMI